MIDIELLRGVRTVYCHGHCPDGLASAMVLQEAFRQLGMTPPIRFLDHGTEEHKKAGTEGPTLFCDITPWRETAVGGRLHPQTIVLDHHAGAEDIVRLFGDRGVFADAVKEPGVSGTVLAFREVWLSVFGERGDAPGHTAAVRYFAECIGARDTWQTKSPKFETGQWMTRTLMSKPASHWLEEGRSACLEHAEVQGGRLLHEQHLGVVQQALEQVIPLMVEGVRLYVFQEQAQGFKLTSDVAEALRSKRPGVMGVVVGFAWQVDADGIPKLVYSLRGLGGFDVCAFAKANGGGGHKAAAGFSFAANGEMWHDPYKIVSSRLAEHLAGHGP